MLPTTCAGHTPTSSDDTRAISEFIVASKRVLLDDADAIVARYRAKGIDIGNPLLLYRLANACRRAGHAALWQAGIGIALTLEHSTYEQIFKRGEAKLAFNDWSGWADYEARIYHSRWAKTNYMNSRELHWTRRRWDGDDDLRGKVLLVVREGGFGDLIQMLRFLPDVAVRAGRVVVAAQPELVSLIRHNYGSIVDVTFPELCGDLRFDYYTWSTSLPHQMGRLPPFVPLVAPRPEQRQPTSAELEIGICWHGGGATGPRDAPLGAFEPLLQHANIRWHCLQVGPHATEANAYAQLLQPHLARHTFADTANLMVRLDLIITTDTSVAHLAGSLGIPTLLLLNYAPCWRWSVGDTTAWYPTVLMIRQTVPGDWYDVVERVRQHIEGILVQRALPVVGDSPEAQSAMAT